jgi:hypothetical protein
MVDIDASVDVQEAAEDVEHVIDRLQFGEGAEVLVNQTSSRKKLWESKISKWF